MADEAQERKRSVVVMGGGTGSYTVLSGLRDHAVDLCSIVTMMDSGGDSGELRDAFGVLPPGDLRRCLVALSDESQILRDLFSFRFEEPPLAGRSLGNLFLLALTQALGSEREAIVAISKILKIRGRVLPVTWDHAHLNAELENGDVIRGESAIDGRGRQATPLPPHDPELAIKNVFLEPPAQANPDALASIADCDAIVLAPGDLYTSTIPNLLVAGIPEALQKTDAPMVYVMNLMTKHGETDHYSASRHVAEIARYAGRAPDAILVHKGGVPNELLRKYASEEARPVQLDFESVLGFGVANIWCDDIISTDSLVRHDPTRTAKALVELIDALIHSHNLQLHDQTG